MLVLYFLMKSLAKLILPEQSSVKELALLLLAKIL